ncbi:MAG: Uncharacterized protein G01um101430_113 [Parcubacteria group bacterium Gr01-1014_30]|nr:MAG: Uncharacterized protein G01um101430_113 [Parcubacteria group bacterium Gr01-1014_30]
MAEEKYPVPEMKPGEEIKILKERLEKLETQLSKETVPVEKEEAVKQEIKSYLQELQQTPSFAPPAKTKDEVSEISKFEPSQQVGALVSLVFQKGLTQAISVARDLDNPAILDEFHDTLADHYYQRLVEEKIV